jgi:branched-chain amino acid transport system ATP-binding protein
MQSEILLQVDNLCKSFGGLRVTNKVSFDVCNRELICVIGPNGAGKTTLFNLLTRHIEPDTGKIIFKGEDLTIGKLHPYDICQRKIGRSFQKVNIFSRLRLIENIQLALLCGKGQSLKFFKPMKKMLREESLQILKEVGLAQMSNEMSGTLAHGDQKRLELAIAIANQPDLLFLDEPTAGMSPEETHNTMELIADIFKLKDISIIVVEHDMEVVFGLSERIIVLHQGEIIADGMPESIKNNAKVQRVYFGDKCETT